MAQNNLKSLFEIFENRIYRIPDYQRGYAWGSSQLGDFWEDICNLQNDRPHYTGVLTLEEVDAERAKKWEEEYWIIQKGYKAYYVVDGQQRLTTAVILMQVILEKMADDETLLHDEKEEIRKKYICQYKSGGILKAYLFGYEKDNPSYEYLKTRIFNEGSNTNHDVETLYTKKLQDAKEFFVRKIKNLDLGNLEELYRKVTMQLKFNIFEIAEQVDVFIAFETMNNRGKRLSTLELLKNRLIYLTTCFTDEDDRDSTYNLRNNINECWKTVYEYLGKNKNDPLDDDTFLLNHWIMYFEYTREKANAYADFLLNEHFTSKRVMLGLLGTNDIQQYVSSLQDTVKQWFFINNPDFNTEDANGNHKYWLRKLKRLHFGAFSPLIMAALQRSDSDQVIKLLIEMERYIFVVFRLSQKRSNTGDTNFYKQALNLYHGKTNVRTIIKEMRSNTNFHMDVSSFKKYIEDRYKFDHNGFYGWSSLKYFLYEYELSLQNQAQGDQKLRWYSFNKNPDTIEHIYPHVASGDCWQSSFGDYSYDQQRYLLHSLGNLLALSRSKNSSLKNSCFTDKKVQSDGNKGYFNGSYSEIEVAQNEDWGPEEIYKRGQKMLAFMSQRWNLNLNENIMKGLLFLDFLNEDSDTSSSQAI
ncbi:DUF262 domain-containing protein [Paenibacillus prosopidis]|uniref:Uncharacterized protein DUF1524 n=1 Tax=Paenibacillus prosopidis TaxID=630520 RepID=A0A368WEB7_9BACL|nr:DUF262 domain-containing protein [Paenibacillus prosopidis]RCW52064.1 uncharacterized protein DUF1524 [Paenibacillus prosopidis]